MSNPTPQELLALAAQSAQRAYAPYSHFRVGAAVLAEGEIFLGANVENDAYSLALCAERAALAAAIVAGKRQISAIAIACIDAPPESDLRGRVPCGACRQWLSELAPQAKIYLLGSEQEFSADQLLPWAFRWKR